MKVEQLKNCKLLADEEDGIKSFASFLQFIIPRAHKNDNLIVDLLKYKDIQLMDMLAFLEISNKHRSQKKSFVLVNDVLRPDNIPEELMIVPTVQEAQDVVDLELIQRDLGF
ncbi:MAG: ribonuclease Z [Leeuwenhoekiella sp.]